ncbi:MAG TPA: hypothetical protein PKM72_14455 [Nitrospirales bacterium]|nr:hypothetical protein [Nitrospirales bacterium]
MALKRIRQAQGLSIRALAERAMAHYVNLAQVIDNHPFPQSIRSLMGLIKIKKERYVKFRVVDNGKILRVAGETLGAKLKRWKTSTLNMTLSKKQRAKYNGLNDGKNCERSSQRANDV